MAGEVVAAEDDELFPAVDFGDRGRRVGVGRFAQRVGGAFDAPDDGAGGRVEREEVGRFLGFHAVEHLDDEFAVDEDRGGAVAVVGAEDAVFFHEIEPPFFGAGEIEADDQAVAGHSPDMFSVGDRRRARRVVLHLELVAAVDLFPPKLPARRAVEAEEQ